MKLEFPKGFLWGSATASYQVEGGIDHNDWALAAREGTVPACGRSCDHFNLYEQDFDIIQGLSQNAHRFSIEWSRIEPEEGKYDAEALAHYQNVLRALDRRGITPFVTLWHFTLPVWLARRGGFAHAETPAIFARYCAHVAKHLSAEFPHLHFLTINEPLVFAAKGYIEGSWAPFRKKRFFTFLTVVHNLIRGHRLAYHAIKQTCPDAKIGIAKNNMYFHATSENPLNKIAAFIMTRTWNRYFLHKIADAQDFIGLNYYMHKPFGPHDNTLPKNDMGWDIFPRGLYHVLMELKRYNKPVYITENGLADSHDIQRKQFIIDHLDAAHRALSDGVDLRGYFYWSLMDNYEWAHGFGPRFGLVEISYDTCERHVRASAAAYKEICENNAIDIAE